MVAMSVGTTAAAVVAAAAAAVETAVTARTVTKLFVATAVQTG